MQITCSQCGGQVDVVEGQTFVKCPFCDSSLFIDKSKIVFHYYIEPSFSDEEAEKNLKRWMAGNYTVKGLDEDAKVEKCELIYFPLWKFSAKTAEKEKKEEVFIAPAAATLYAEIRDVELPPGKLIFYTGEYAEGKSFAEPSIPYNSALAYLKSSAKEIDKLEEVSLVHVPVFHFSYIYKDKRYSAVVDAATGKVFANVYPAKSDAPFKTIALIAAGVFLFEGMIFQGFGMKLIVYLISAVPLIIAADYVAEHY